VYRFSSKVLTTPNFCLFVSNWSHFPEPDASKLRASSITYINKECSYMSILTGLTLYACPLPATTSLSPAIVFHPNEKYFSSVRRNQSSDPGSGRGQVSPPLPKRLQTRRALELIQSGYLDPHGCCHPIRIKCGESDENKLLTNVILADMFSSFRTVRYAPLMAISNGRPSNGVAV
jgi:hypothetical protein